MSVEGHWQHLGSGRSGVSPVTHKLMPTAVMGCLALAGIETCWANFCSDFEPV